MELSPRQEPLEGGQLQWGGPMDWPLGEETEGMVGPGEESMGMGERLRLAVGVRLDLLEGWCALLEGLAERLELVPAL